MINYVLPPFLFVTDTPLKDAVHPRGSVAKQKPVIILGAGISGLTAAHFVSNEQSRDVHIIDSFVEPGGNHRSENLSGYTFDMGSFVFWDKNPFFKMFPTAAAMCQPATFEMQRLTPAGSISVYPFSTEKDLLRRGPVYVAGIALSMLISRIKIREPGNAEEYALRYMGKRLYRDSGLGYYLDRFYGIAGSKVAVSFAQKRMAWIASLGSVSSIKKQARAFSVRKLRRSRPSPDVNPFQFNVFVRPKAGFHFMYRAALTQVQARGAIISLSTSIDKIECTNDRFRVFTSKGVLESDRLISTLPLAITLKLLGHSPSLAPPTLPLTILMVSFQGMRGFKAPVLFNFHPDGRWKRLTMHSDNYGKCEGREYFNVEITGSPGEQVDTEVLMNDFVQHVRRAGLFDGDLHLEGSHQSEYGYPIYTIESLKQKEAVIALLTSFGVETTGRQGGYDYLSNAGLVTTKVVTDLASNTALHIGASNQQ